MGLHWTIPQAGSRSNPTSHSSQARSDSTTSAPATHSRRARWTGGIVGVLFILSLGCWSPVFGADWSPKPNPPNCPAGYRCLTIDDYAHMTEVKINLEYEVKRLKARRTFHTLGAEYLPGGTVEPYGLTGLNFGPISMWGGFFGKQPALGVGFSW